MSFNLGVVGPLVRLQVVPETQSDSAEQRDGDQDQRKSDRVLR